MRIALGLSYRGGAYAGWQVQPGIPTVQREVEVALSAFAAEPLSVTCAGRTDAGVHATGQVVHVDTSRYREPFSWVRGTNRYLPPDIAVQWCRPVGEGFHARFAALGRRYRYVLLESPVRPALDTGRVGWTFRPLDGDAMRRAATALLGEHDFSAFRSSECQARSPVKTMRTIAIVRRGAHWQFDFDASAFLHHMVRNLMGCLVLVGAGRRDPAWLAEVLASRDRERAAPTFAPDGLYFLGPYYDAAHGIPDPAADSVVDMP
jgi:tRNA pseudouridine38-40 synthase